MLLLLPACTETPLDATLLEMEAGPIMTAVPDCVVPEPALDSVYAIVSKPTGRCLRSGEVTNIDGTLSATGYTVELVDCDGSPEQEWLLHGTLNQLEIRHVLLGLNLDLEGGALSDDTEALLFYPHGNRNQLFRLSPLADNSQEIRATATENSCLEAMLSSENSVELQGCPNVATRVAPYQNWFFAEAECDESAD